jgi:hypothetical protein
MPLEDQILQAIKSAMPENAEIRVVQSLGSLNVGVSWKLNDDPDRPNKMSKAISICVSHEAAQDFASASQSNQQGAYQRVSNFLAKKLSTFDPQHSAQKYEAPPVEKWVIGTEIVNG